MSMQPHDATTAAENRVTLGCFEVGGGLFALDVSQLREVVRWRAATPLPKAPQLIEGVIDLRDSVIPVIDLGRALGSEPIKQSEAARIAIADVDGLVMGLAVDAAIEVLAVDVTSLEDPPSLATQAGYDAARAVVRRPGAAPILVLSLEHILESVYRSALPSGGAAS
jgi:purine-binding chemotaxis protein CheW